MHDRKIEQYFNPDDKDLNKIGVIIGNKALFPTDVSMQQYAITCFYEWKKNHSSAQDLDNQISKKGIKTTRKFSYQYNIGVLTTEQIIKDSYCLQWFYLIYEACVGLNSAKYRHLDKFNDIIYDAFRLSYYYAQYLWAMNPRAYRDISNALRMPGVKNWKQINAAILGIGYQFHPDDVYEYVVNYINPHIVDSKKFHIAHKEQQVFKDKMKELYNIDTGCLVLSPKSRDKLTKILTNTDISYRKQLIEQFWGILVGHIK